MSHVAVSHRAEQPCLVNPDFSASSRRQHLADRAERLCRTIAVARGLIAGGRHLDVTGIDDGVGVLCAQTLDLPTDEARAMLPVLRGVLAQLDLLAAVLKRPGTDPVRLP